MGTNSNLFWNSVLFTIRKFFSCGYKYHCNICGYPTNDINILHAHGLKTHADIMQTHLLKSEIESQVVFV